MKRKPVSAKQSARKVQLEQKKEPAAPETGFAKIQEAVSENKERLMRIFAYYCSFGEPLNTNMLRSSKFIKLLKDAKLLQSAPSHSGGNTTSNKMKQAKAYWGQHTPPLPRPLR